MKKLNVQQLALRKIAKPKCIEALMYFYKTGPGQYGEGDQFIGVSVPANRSIALQFLTADKKDISQLLQSPIHEDRALGLHILTENYRRTKDLKKKKAIVSLYLKHKKYVNNWDLVDRFGKKMPRTMLRYSIEKLDPDHRKKILLATK